MKRLSLKGITTLILLIPLVFQSTAFYTSTTTYIHTIKTSKQYYITREQVTIIGNITADGTPVNNILISIQVNDPRNNPIYFRTIPIGNPSETWPIQILTFTLKDLSGKTLSKALLNSRVIVYIKVRNPTLTSRNVTATLTICDETLIPFFAGFAEQTLEGNTTTEFSWMLQIPEWAKAGKALVFANVYNQLPKDQGVSYCPETMFLFDIVRNLDAGPSLWISTPTYQSTVGEYQTYLRIPPGIFTRPGTYTVFSTARVSPAIRIFTSSSFQFNYYPCPPQAAFTYSPLQVYQNMTVTFDASSSSAEGYNDYITSYKWKINDPYNPRTIITTNPIITHTFKYPGTYTVELNVTDSEGLWSVTSKPIIVNPEFGPTANFTWSPTPVIINSTVTFDASSSKPGWSASTQQFSPIVSYEWDFGDGSMNQTSSPITTHKYTAPGNYTVMLKVTDAVGRTDTITKIVEVLNVTLKSCDVNGDGKIDIRDIFACALAYGSKPGDPNWDPRCDVIKDNKIDIRDMFAIAINYGKDP
ncbi:MAG: PKD domain-containing protein [Nitrososphaerota archaeon]